MSSSQFRSSTNYELGQNEARALTSIFREAAGLAFGDDSAYVLERRLRERLIDLELRSFREYLDYLRDSIRGERELDEALELVTTHETYFFREDYQLRAFRDELLPRLVESCERKQRLQVWSAGCSTGEEVYSLAMILHASPLFSGWEMRVFGTDISRRCIQAARRAEYGDASFRDPPRDFAYPYFEQRGSLRGVKSEIRDMCTFNVLNLVDTSRTALVARADVIFCRNVLIYLDAEARAAVIDTLYERLAPGGYLLLGHSESLLNVASKFEPMHLKQDLVYRKPGFAELSLSDNRGPRRGEG